MVKEYARGGMEAIAFAVIDSEGVGEELGATVGAAWVENGGFGLRRRGGAVHLAGGGLVEAAVQPGAMNGFEEAKCAHADGITGILGDFKADLDVALSAEVVDLVGADVIEQAGEGSAVGKVSVMEEESGASRMDVLVEVIVAIGIEAGGAAFQAVYLVTFFEKEFGEVGAILAGDAGDECAFHSFRLSVR